ncbi:MAG: tripartite tricarboxylate transporter substrate binding protein [Burkholderiales bacterium]|nr:tripartite tricarboxylate transporter substrate binding protein [Burkholderiales bacterium]
MPWDDARAAHSGWEFMTVCALLAVAGAPAHGAEAYPDRPVRMIVPQAAGGSTDFISRQVAQQLSDLWSQSVVVDNRPGANANIGMDLAARAPKDGYTLLMGGSAPITINPALYRKMPVDPLKDFDPVTLIVYSTSVLVAHPSVTAKTIGELIALAKAKPGQLTYASAGAGSTPHLSAEMFKHMAGIDLLHVPYKGSTPGVLDTMAGRTQIMFTGIASALGFVKAGKLKALSVNGPKRSPALPEVPTAGESGLPGFEVDFWIGTFVPSGVPKAVVDVIHKSTVRMLENKDTRDKLMAQGTAVVGAGPAEFAAIIKRDAERWAQVVRAAKLRIE